MGCFEPMTPVIGLGPRVSQTQTVEIEAVVLTGGASRRMGRDKAALAIKGTPQAVAILERLSEAGYPCTVLGRTPVQGYAFLPDQEEFRGPLSALKGLSPSADYVFVCACDVPLFDYRVVGLLKDRIESKDACLMVVGGERQPLMALYARSTFEKMKLFQGDSLNRFLDGTELALVGDEELTQFGVHRLAVKSANTAEELGAILEMEQ